VAIPQDWMPPALSDEAKDAYAGLFPTDPHRAAAAAWSGYAATLPATPQVSSVSTGDQSVSYTRGGSVYDAAVQRADWHLSRARVQSVALVGAPSIVIAEGHREMEGTIPTFISPPVGGM
jgi:hypothetical protein